MRALWLALLLAGCRLDTDYSGTAYRCDGACPSGQECRAGTCVAIGSPDAADRADAALAGYPAEVLADRPILYLRLDEAAGTVAMDSSGAGRHGAYLGGVAHLAEGAVPGGGCAGFDGIDDRVVVPDDPALRLDGDFTIELWIRVDGVTANYPGVLSKVDHGDTGTGTGYMLYYPADSVYWLVLKRAGVDGKNSGQPVVEDRFRHLAVTYQAAVGEIRWYVDGAHTTTYAEVAYPANLDDVPLSIAMANDFGQESIDELAIYDRVLPEARVLDHVAAAAAALR